MSMDTEAQCMNHTDTGDRSHRCDVSTLQKCFFGPEALIFGRPVMRSLPAAIC